MGDDWAIYIGPVGPTAWHRHHAMQVLCAQRRSSVALEVGDELVTDEAVIVAPDQRHRVVSSSPCAALLFLDPQSRATAALCHASRNARGFIRGSSTESLAIPNNWSDAAALVVELMSPFGPSEATAHRAAAHRAVRHAIQQLPDAVAAGPVSLARVALSAGVSASRLGHVFREGTGIAWRAYVRWVRLQVSARAIAEGANLTDAAHRGGFADSAHFTRTFRSMFGLAPSTLRHVRWLART